MSTTLIIMLVCIIIIGCLCYIFMKNPAKNKKTKKLRFRILLALILAALICALIEFGPRGMGALWRKKGIGENKGSGSTENYAAAVIDEETDTPAISVAGMVITVGSKSFSENEYEQFAAYAAQHAGDWESIHVIDAYAASLAYHYVIDTLNANSISYVEIQE